MSLLWPGFLYSLLLIPLAIAVYVWSIRRRRRFAVRYSSLSLVRAAATKQSGLRKHFPFMLFLLALASLGFALTRPVATVVIPSNKATVILAVDVSLSMCSTDIPPNRLEVAKDSARTFIRDNVTSRQIGIVAFAGFAELIQPPTNDVRSLDNALGYLAPGRRTAIGSAILRSLDAISQVDSRVAPSKLDPTSSTDPNVTQVPASPLQAPAQYSPHIIVLLTDGASNAGPLPIAAAQQAAERGVRIYTIGFGTSNPAPMNCGDGDLFGGFTFNGGGSGGGFGGGGGRTIDESTLKQVASMTGGKYYSAETAGELRDALKKLPTYVVATRETTEITVFFTAIAVLLGIAAMVLAFLWYPLS